MKKSYLVASQLYQEAVERGAPEDICHCCGAAVAEGLKGCFELFSELCVLGYSDPAYGAATFYGVDAHALQHPEIHGKKNNAAHLLRLCWIFERNEHRQAGLVPSWWQRYLERNDVPVLDPPPSRGQITVADVAPTQTPEEHARLMRRWALSVYEAWSPHHDWARRTLKEILA